MGRIDFTICIILLILGSFFIILLVSNMRFDPFRGPPLPDICIVNIQTNLSRSPPLLLQPSLDPNEIGQNALYLPMVNNVFVVQKNGIINLSCPNDTVYLNSLNTKASILPVKCIGKGTIFEVVSTKEKAYLSSFACLKPEDTARYPRKNCLENYKEIEVGFPINKTTFLKQMSICFDSDQLNPAFSVYNLTNRITNKQTGLPRPEFKPGNFYNPKNIDIHSLYSRKTQRETINKQLGLPSTSQMYIKDEGNYFLSKGHLTPKGDFIYGSQQNATFYYVNTAPQWQIINGGNWEELEYSIFELASYRGWNLEIYTGTHDVMTLPHSITGRQTPLYLYNDNGNTAIPVPKMFWKVAYDPRFKEAVAFVGLNNPYNEVTPEDILCQDICDRLMYPIYWDQKNRTLGYGYCCDVNELRLKIKNIPDLDINDVL